MKKLFGIMVLVLVAFVAYPVDLTITVTTAQATLITNAVTRLNAQNGTALTVEQAIARHGAQALIERERDRLRQVVGDAYVSANQSTRNSVNSALGVTP